MTHAIPAPEPDLTQEVIVQRARDTVPTLRARQEQTEDAGRPGRDEPRVHRRRLLPDPPAEAVRRLRVRPADLLARRHPARARLRLQRLAVRAHRGPQHLLAASFSDEAQTDIAGADGDFRVPGRFRPGSAVEVDGGYRVTGTFGYVQGLRLRDAPHVQLLVPGRPVRR